MIRTLTVTAPRQGLHEITSQVASALEAAKGGTLPEGGLQDGLCTLFIQHTSASLTIQENADPSACRDLEAWLQRLVPEGDSLFTHTSEGPDDMPSHIRAALTSTSLSVPIVNGRLALGTWQGIFLWEHRRRVRPRRIVLHVSS